MSTEITTAVAAVIDMTSEETRSQIAALQTAHALALELNSGMKMSNRWSPLKNAKTLGFKGSKKAAALAWLVTEFQLTPSDRIVKALNANGYEVLLQAPAE